MQNIGGNTMKQLDLTEMATPNTLPLHEHNARRRRAKVVATPGKANQPHSAPHKASTRVTEDAGTLLDTYSQFTPQGTLHE